MSQIAGIAAIALLVPAGIAAANVIHDRGANTYLARRIPALLGGVAFLFAVLWLGTWTAVAVGAVATAALAVLRLRFRRSVRGVAGGSESRSLASITYPLAGTASLAIGWGLLGDRWLAFAPIAFMAWGDNAAGLARATIWQFNERSVWPSVGMLAVCVIAGILLQPPWVGVAGAAVATAVERFRPVRHPLWDDNPLMVGASLGLMVAMLHFGMGGTL